MRYRVTTNLAIRLAKPALALRKLSLSLPGPSARKTWANTLIHECHRCRAWSTVIVRVTGEGTEELEEERKAEKTWIFNNYTCETPYEKKELGILCYVVLLGLSV